MKYKGLKKVMSICLSICMVCMPLSVNAQEINKDAVGSIQENDVFIQNSIPTENVDTYASNIEKSNTYEEITQTSENIEEYTKNNMERPYEGEKFRSMQRVQIVCHLQDLLMIQQNITIHI